MSNIKIKYILYSCIPLLGGCLLPMPYGYFQITRFIVMVFFILTGFYFWENAKNQTLAIAYFTSALFINPIFKIALGRTLWNIIDVIWVIFIIVTLKNHLNDTN